MSTAEYHHDARLGRPAQLANKMPQITAVFWITKILTTGMGESASDYFTHVLGRGLAISLGGAGLAVALVLQFSFRRYVVWAYWLAIVMVSVFGTMAADGLHRLLGVPFWASTAFYGLALAVIFVAWYSIEKTLSIHTIYTRRRETFYWAIVLATFALGTAAGDWTATTLRIGYLASGIMFAVIFAIPAVAHWWFGLNATLAFWFAYVITRPFGASFADWFAASPKRHGLGLGTGPVTLASTIIIAGLVGYLAITHKATGNDDITALGRTPAAVGDAEPRDDN